MTADSLPKNNWLSSDNWENKGQFLLALLTAVCLFAAWAWGKWQDASPPVGGYVFDTQLPSFCTPINPEPEPADPGPSPETAQGPCAQPRRVIVYQVVSQSDKKLEDICLALRFTEEDLKSLSGLQLTNVRTKEEIKHNGTDEKVRIYYCHPTASNNERTQGNLSPRGWFGCEIVAVGADADWLPDAVWIDQGGVRDPIDITDEKLDPLAAYRAKWVDGAGKYVLPLIIAVAFTAYTTLASRSLTKKLNEETRKLNQESKTKATLADLVRQGVTSEQNVEYFNSLIDTYDQYDDADAFQNLMTDFRKALKPHNGNNRIGGQ